MELIGYLMLLCYIGLCGLAIAIGPMLLLNKGLISQDVAKSESFKLFLAMFWPLFLLVMIIWKCIWPILDLIFPYFFTKGWAFLALAFSQLIQFFRNKQQAQG